MRNRAGNPPRDESAFINGGTAGVDKAPETSSKFRSESKAKPVSISLFEENLTAIDNIIRDEMVSGGVRVNRSDVVRAAIDSLKKLSKSEVSRMIADVKQK